MDLNHEGLGYVLKENMEFVLLVRIRTILMKKMFMNNFFYAGSYVQVCLSYKMLGRRVKDSASCKIWLQFLWPLYPIK
jgi:hypothetical protein